MGRLDFKRGRFNVAYETTLIHEALRGRQGEVGEKVQWWRFDHENTVVDDIFDEGAGVGKVYRGPFRIPVLHVSHVQGPMTGVGTGFYTNDAISITASYDQMRRLLGISDQVGEAGDDEFLRDRIVYDNAVFRITGFSVLGQVQNRDIIVSLDATQVKGDELVNDAQFSGYSD